MAWVYRYQNTPQSLPEHKCDMQNRAPKNATSFRLPTHRRSWTEHTGRSRICHSSLEITCDQLASLPSFSERHHTLNKDSIACKATGAISITRPDSSDNGQRHVKETQSRQADSITNLNGTHYHRCPSQIAQLFLRMRL